MASSGKDTFESVCRDNLLALAGGYAEAKGLSLATVSRKFHGNQAFFSDFKKGDRSITLSKVAEMLNAIRKAWPPGTPKPKLRSVPMI